MTLKNSGYSVKSRGRQIIIFFKVKTQIKSRLFTSEFSTFEPTNYLIIVFNKTEVQ